MPKVLIIRQFVFLLYSSDIHEKRKHIHVEVRKGHRRKVAKFWLDPEIELVKKGNLTDKEISISKKLIDTNFEILIHQIERFNRNQKVTTIKK